MTIKKKLVVTTGTYTNGAGEKKKRYQNIGELHEGEYGDYITLSPGVSLGGLYAMQKDAGVSKPGDNRLFVNLYDDDGDRGQQRPQQRAAQDHQQPPQQQQQPTNTQLNDDIPF